MRDAPRRGKPRMVDMSLPAAERGRKRRKGQTAAARPTAQADHATNPKAGRKRRDGERKQGRREGPVQRPECPTCGQMMPPQGKCRHPGWTSYAANKARVDAGVTYRGRKPSDWRLSR